MLVLPTELKLTSRFSNSEYIFNWNPSRLRELNAIRELSGETRGESEICPRCVMACWLAPS